MAEQPRNEEVIFLAALEKATPQERNAFVEGACTGDSDLLQRVRELLDGHDESMGPLDSPAPGIDATIDQPITEKPGTVIGPYKLLQKIGEGGFGVVYMADQTEPVKRRLALKIIKPGMDTRQVIARFEAERQALAMMDHPNIAKVLDAGTTDSGRPYFVMELVKGVPITQFCDEKHLTPRERLELFVPVCEAIQHAHQKGIIHRDIKPSNVLIAEYDDRAIPKVIDFGVAKAVEQQLTEKTMFTQLGQVIGTLDYMSPEQAKLNQLDIDTRSDIYSLGVLLYELLAGETPFDRQRLRSAAFDELLRIIREEEPPRPSLRLSNSESLPSIAANRHTEPKKLSTAVRGELDWIVMKALEKDRTRRYETASNFSADIERYLSDEPVQACPPSAAYRFKKFARRNKGAITTTAIVAVSLLVGTGIATWQAIRATRAGQNAVMERDRAFDAEQTAREEAARADKEAANARTDAAIARAVNDFINQDLLGSANPRAEPNRDLKVREVLDRASLNLEGRLEDQPLVNAAILYTLGKTYAGLGEYEKARQHMEQSRRLREKELGADHVDTLSAANGQGIMILDLGRYEEAEKLHREVLEIRQRVLGPEHPDTLSSMNNLAMSLNRLGRCEEAEKLHREVLEIRQRVLGLEHPDTLSSMNSLANRAKTLGRHEDAEKLYGEVLEIQRRVLGPEHLDTLGSMYNLANAIWRQLRCEEAEKLHREVLEIRQRVLGPDHPHTLDSMNSMAGAILGQARYEEAEKLFRENLETRRRVQGPEHPNTLLSMESLAVALEKQGRPENETLFLEVLEIQRRVLGTENPQTRHAARNLAVSCCNRCWKLATAADVSERDPAKAVELASLVIELRPESTANGWNNLGVAQYRAGDWQAAVEALEKADAMIEGGDRVHRMFFAMAYWQLGDKEKARELYAQGAAWIAKHRKDNEEQGRFRAEAEELMKISEEDRERLVEEYLAHSADEAAERPKEKPNDKEPETGRQEPEEVEPEEEDTDP